MSNIFSLATIKDVILFGLGIYGAVLSTFNWRQAVRKDRRIVNVTVSSIIPAYGNSLELGKTFAKVEATNAGHRPVTVVALTLELVGGGRLASFSAQAINGLPDTILPVTLSDGQSAISIFSYQEIGEALLKTGRANEMKLIPICEDSVGGIYRGKHWTVEPSEFARM